MEIPFGKYKELPVNIKNNTSDEITEYLLNANRILNKAVFGHKKGKVSDFTDCITMDFKSAIKG